MQPLDERQRFKIERANVLEALIAFCGLCAFTTAFMGDAFLILFSSGRLLFPATLFDKSTHNDLKST